MPSVTGGFLRCKHGYSPASCWARLRRIRPSAQGEAREGQKEETMPTCYIVAYDIADPKRLRRVHRTMRGYGEPLQYSVFHCILSPSERVLLLEALTPVINHREDQVMFINLGPADGRAHSRIETLG